MNTYIVFAKKGAAATGGATIKLQAERHSNDSMGQLYFMVGDNEVARFAAGEWVGVVEDKQLLSS